MDVIAINEHEFAYIFSLFKINSKDLDVEEFKKVMKLQVLHNLCSNKQINNFFNENINIRSIYKTKDDTEIANILVTPNDCAQIK